MVNNSLNIKAETQMEYFLKLLEMELEHRDNQRKEKYLKNAGFHTLKSFDDFRFDRVTLPSEISPEYLKNCKFIDDKINLVLYGNVGTGKSHLVTALGVEACRRGQSVKFFRTAALVNRLSEARKNKDLNTFMNQIMKVDFLILDEWGYVPMDRDGARLLFEIISECYEKKSIAITTNIEFSRWVHILYDEQMTGALLDRLLHHCHLLIFDGDSERMKTSLIKQG
jgi:DNA replication protein DnaC